MDRNELMKQLEQAKNEHIQMLVQYQQWYVKEGVRNEDGFEILERLPSTVEWILEEGRVVMKGHAEGLQEMSYIIKTFAHDEETNGIFYKNYLLLKHHEPMPYEDLIVIAMPDEAWAFWGGKMADVAWGNDWEELTFNEVGFYEETLPVDIGVILIKC